jgi:hypothetical protein
MQPDLIFWWFLTNFDDTRDTTRASLTLWRYSRDHSRVNFTISLQYDSSFAKSPAARVDYSNFIADLSTAAGGVVTQISDVPESYTLYAINDKLTNANDFDT